MNRLLPRNIVIAAALFGIAAGTAWSETATPSEPATPAEQTAAPGYAPAQNRRGYEHYWQPPRWSAPPPAYYGHYRPYYPPYPQYRAAPPAPTANPLSAELKQTQQQLAAKTAELKTANEQLNTLQTEQQATREALQQAQSATAKISEQLSVVLEQMNMLNDVLSGLTARQDAHNISQPGTLPAGTEENDEVGSAATGGAEQEQSPATTSAQPGNAGDEQTEAGDNELSKPEAL